MFSFTINPTPTLVVDGEEIHGINILDKLHQLMETSPEAKKLFLDVASIYQRTQLPRLGFRLEDPSAIMPTKRITDVGYDLTVVAIHSRPTRLTTMYESYVSLNIPLGYCVELVPRSSISKTGYMLANNVGIIDPGYTGTVKVPLIKVDQSAPNLELPAKVCQLLLKPYVVSEPFDATEMDCVKTHRGAGGFGSTDYP